MGASAGLFKGELGVEKSQVVGETIGMARQQDLQTVRLVRHLARGHVVDVIDDGKTGLLVPPADPAGIAEAVIRLMKDKPLAAMLADEKLCHMALYGLETIPDPSVDDALRDALGDRKSVV